MSGFSIKGNENIRSYVCDTLESVVADSGEVLSHLKATDAERASARHAAVNANDGDLRAAEWREGAIVVATSAEMLAQKCIKELDGDDAEAAIVAALTAQSLLTKAVGVILGVKIGAQAKRVAKAAGVRHAKSRENRERVFAWCDENMSLFPSMDKAAEDIAETFIDEKFRTVRDWMTDWKKLRSAKQAGFKKTA